MHPRKHFLVGTVIQTIHINQWQNIQVSLILKWGASSRWYFSANVPSNDWELLVLELGNISFINSLWYRQNQVQLSLVSVSISGQVLDSLLLNLLSIPELYV